MTKFLLIRHATTDAVGKCLSGRKPGVHLNTMGLEQARLLSERLKHLPISAVYSSPLERALETAAPLCKLLDRQCQTADEFLELDFGQWTNATFQELGADAEFERFNTLRSLTRIPGGESMQEAQTRMISGLSRLAAKHPNEVVAIFSHSDMIKAAIAHYAGIHLDLFQRIEISPASVSVIEIFEDALRLVTINNTGTIG